MNGPRPGRVLRDGVVAGTAGAVLGGLPSTVHALVTGGDPLEAGRAAGSLLLPGEQRTSRLLPAGAVAHAGISLAWGVVLAATLPRRRTLPSAAAAGLVIAALDLGLVARAFPRVRALPVLPQLVDHVAYGAVVGAVLAHRRRGRLRPSGARSGA